jgi:plastocyanin
MTRTNRRALPLAAALALGLSFSAYPVAADPGAPSQIATADAGAVTIDNFAFEPQALIVTPGTKVTWTNRDDEPHTVVSAGGQLFKSPALDTGDKFSFTFVETGTYTYFCSVHPHMTGTIVVK